MCECPFVENTLDRRSDSQFHQGRDADFLFGASVNSRPGRNVEENMGVR